MKHLRSLREFIAALEAIGDVQPIDKQVDWNLELGAIARRSYELRAPAPLFTNITGDKDGFRALAAPGGLSAVPGMTYARIALALGLPADAKGADIVTALADARAREPIPPRILPTGPWRMQLDASVSAQRMALAAKTGTTSAELAADTSAAPALAASDRITLYMQNADIRFDYFVVIDTLP